MHAIYLSWIRGSDGSTRPTRKLTTLMEPQWRMTSVGRLHLTVVVLGRELRFGPVSRRHPRLSRTHGMLILWVLKGHRAIG